MTITLTFPDGRKATIGEANWQSDSPELAALLDILTAGDAASYLPHPMLFAAKDAAKLLGATIDFEDDPEADPPGELPLIH
jgi:hypothetical protein